MGTQSSASCRGEQGSRQCCECRRVNRIVSRCWRSAVTRRAAASGGGDAARPQSALSARWRLRLLLERRTCGLGRPGRALSEQQRRAGRAVEGASGLGRSWAGAEAHRQPLAARLGARQPTRLPRGGWAHQGRRQERGRALWELGAQLGVCGDCAESRRGRVEKRRGGREEDERVSSAAARFQRCAAAERRRRTAPHPSCSVQNDRAAASCLLLCNVLKPAPRNFARSESRICASARQVRSS